MPAINFKINFIFITQLLLDKRFYHVLIGLCHKTAELKFVCINNHQ
ncbi:hypothetical protein PMAN_a2709 [Pseudoalteromonas marina]|nr:hypothetical protein PMAN_a2709 [Pseudoalteromonas marina]